MHKLARKFGIIMENRRLTTRKVSSIIEQPPQAPPWGVRPSARYLKVSLVQGPFQRPPGRPRKAETLPRLRGVGQSPTGTPHPPLVGGKGVPHLIIRMPTLTTQGQKRGGVGRRAQYLLDILGTTDRSPPFLAFDNMTVRFVFAGDESYYSFSAEFIRSYNISLADSAPYGFKSVYGRDTEMFAFLDSVIGPSCLERIVTQLHPIENYVGLVYNIDHVSLADLDRFMIPYEEDFPF